MLQNPAYIPIAEIAAAPVVHTWDEWDPYLALGLQHEKTELQLARLTDRAIIAYSIGCAEWVVYRFAGVSQDIKPLLFIEACWAFVMDDRVAPPPASNEDEWQGPVRAAIDLSLMTILNTIVYAETKSAYAQGAFAELIVFHVLPDTSPFLKWREKVFSRLEAHFPRKADFEWGPPVSREILNTSADVSQLSQSTQIAKFLSRISPEQNEFFKLIS